MKYPINHYLLRLAVIIAMILCGTARGDQAAIAFDTTQYWNLATGTGVYGWQFTTASNIQISALCIYDNQSVYVGGYFPGDGLLESHTIGIWDVSDVTNPLVALVISSGTNAPLVDGFRLVEMDPLILLANHDYVIAATYQGQDWVTGDVNNPTFALTVSPEIIFGGYRSSSSSEIAFPDTYGPGQMFGFGPNFIFTVVPELSAFTLSMFGSTVLCSLIKMSSRRTNRKNSVQVEPHVF